MQVILAAMGGGAPGTMTAECAGALAAGGGVTKRPCSQVKTSWSKKSRACRRPFSLSRSSMSAERPRTGFIPRSKQFSSTQRWAVTS